MTKSIYDILSTYKYSIDTEETFIKSIKQVSKQINIVTEEYDTPIMHYCSVHLNAGISSFVIRTLITQFHADISTMVRGRIPLSILLEDKDSSNLLKNIEIIELLYEYTNTQGILTAGSPKIITNILLKLPLSSPAIDYRSLQARIHILSQKIAANKLSKMLFDSNRELLDGLFSVDTPERIKLILNFMHWNKAINIVVEDLLCKAIEKKHIVLVNTILELYTINLNTDPNPMMINPVNINVKAHDALLQNPDITSITQIISKQIEQEIYDYTNTNIIVICGKVIDMNNLILPNIKDDTYSKLIFSANRIIQQNIDVESGTINYAAIGQHFGFNNNILHYLALTTLNADQFIEDKIDATLLLQKNAFGQTPLKIALLCNNKPWMHLLKSILSNQGNPGALYGVDYHQNTVGHILAIKPLPLGDLQWILDTLAPLLDTKLILLVTNKFGQSPIHLAVLTHNIPFIAWWKEQGGSFAVQDGTGKTLWHYFIASQVTNVNDSDIRYIRDVLNDKIPLMVSHADDDGVTPIMLALTLPSALALLLNDHGNDINYQHQDHKGNTISHILATNFVDYHNRAGDYISNIHNKIVTLLIPYASKIQQNYSILNDNQQYPINIIEQRLGNKLSFWLHRRVNHDILKMISESLEMPFKTTNTAITTFASSEVPINKLRLKLDNTHLFCDNKFIFFSKELLLKTYEVKTLYPSTIDIIRALSFEIAYSNQQESNDSILQFLLSIDPLGLDVQLTVWHILKILDNRVVVNICNTSNKLGEYLVHTVVEYDRDIILHHLLSVDPKMLSQATQTLTDNTEFVPLYPCDYVMVLQTNRIRAVIKEFKSKNPNYKLISNINAISTNLNVNEEIINNYFLGEVGNQYELALQSILVSLHDPFFQKLIKHIERNSAHNYFPLFGSHIKYLQNKYLSLIYKDGYDEIYGLNHLEEYLVWYKQHSHQYPRFISFLEHAHASSLVLFKDHTTQFRVLIHDSGKARGHAYQMRLEQIKHTLCTCLKIDILNIHELDAPQQDTNQQNCILWTIVNLQLIEHALLKQESNCVSCIPLPYNRNTILWKDPDNKLQQINSILETSAKLLVNFLESEISKCHQYSCTISESFIRFQKLFDISVSNHDNTLGYIDQQVVQDRKLPLLIEDIISIVDIYYDQIFKIYTIDQDYYYSDNGLVILEGSKDDNKILRNQITQFLDIIFVPTHYDDRDQNLLLKRVFIINQDAVYWVTLVMVANAQRITIYFADSLANSMPGYIKTIIQSALSPYNIAVEMHEQIVETKQLNYHYDSGLWAIRNAHYILNACTHDQDLSALKAIMQDNIEQDSHQIMQQRVVLNMKHVRSIHHTIPFQALAEQIKEIGLTPHQTSSCTQSAIIPSHRKKRTICNKKQSTEPKVDILSKLQIPKDDKIDMQLYFNIACLAALQDSTDDKKSTIHNTLRYIGGMYDILSEGPDNRSVREQAIIDRYYRNVNEPGLLSTIKNQLFSQSQYLQQDDGVIFYNDHCSIIVFHTNDYYLLYSQNYLHTTVFKTKDGVKFDDIQKFVKLFFAFYSVDLLGYHMFFLDDNQYKKDVWSKLEKADIWNNDDIIKSDLALLLESDDQKIEDVPKSIIRTIFFVNNQVPDFRLLHDDFFSTHLKSISLRIDQIHKAFLSLDIEQLKPLKRLIKKYDFPCDTTYLDKINPNTPAYTKVLISSYHIQMAKQLKHIDELTLGGIKALTQKIFTNLMKTLGISPELSARVMENMDAIYSSFAHYPQLPGHKITQVSFFMPDLMKAFNYNQYIPLLQSSGVLIADTQASQYMVKLYRRVIDKMKPHLDPTILDTIQSIPVLENSLHEGLENAVQNPIFKIMTLYALKQLLQKLDTMDPSSTEYETINHKLHEEYVTIGFMSLELCNIEMTPAWFALMMERLRYDGHQIALSHHLDIPVWQETLIGLGFYQEKVDYMIEESDLINYNLQLVVAATKHFVHEQNHTSTGLYIIKIPHFLKEKIRYPINAEQVPKNIQTTLINKASKEFDGFVNFMGGAVGYYVPDARIAIEHNYRITYYNEQNYTYHMYKYNASGSNTTIIFREYTDQEYKKSGPKDYVFTDVIKLLNSTWLRLPKAVDCITHLTNLWCRKPQQSFVTRDTGDAALYYSNKNIDQTLFHKNISYVFDPREGNMSITFTPDVIKKLNQNPKKWYCNIFVNNKDYPAILAFQGEYPQASCMLDDPTNLIIPRYFILNNHSPFMLDDNAKVRDITAATVQTPYSNTTYQTIISGTSKNITLDSTDGIKSHLSTIMSAKNKDKLYIYLDHSAYLIGDTLSLSDKDIYIDNIRGQSNQSTIVFTGQNDQKFRLTLLGDIVVSDVSHSRLCILGHYQFKGSVYSKWHDSINSYTEYKLDVQDFSSVFNTVRQLLQDNGTQYIEFTDINNVQYKWYRHKSSGHLVITSSDVPGVVLQISSEFNVLEFYHQSTLQYSFATVHYDEIMQYNGDCVIKKIFINSNKSFEPTNIMQNMQNASNFNDYSFLSSMNGSMIILFSHGHEWYNIWPFRRDITINNINYKITEDGICHMPSDHTNDNGHNHVLEYVDSNSYYSKNSRVPNCNHEPSRVKARAERSISNADDAVYHPAGISDADGQDVNNNGTGILDNNSDQIPPITSGGSSLSSFAHTILKSMSAPLSWLMTRIKHYYTPLPNQISRQISSVEKDIKIDHEVSYTEELNNSITQQEVVEAISSDANSHGTAKMLNHYTNFVINKNNGNCNIINNLKLGDSSHNGSAQVINTFNINGNLMLGQILAYKFCGKNQLFQNTCYLSPTQERNILLEQLSSQVLSMCNDFINDTHTFDYNNAPSWYQDLWRDNF